MRAIGRVVEVREAGASVEDPPRLLVGPFNSLGEIFSAIPPLRVGACLLMIDDRREGNWELWFTP